MAASVGPDGGQYGGQQVLIDRFLGSRQCRVKVLLLSGPDQRGGAAGTLDGVLVGQKAHIGAMTLAHLDDATGDRTDLLAHQLGYVRIPASTARYADCNAASSLLGAIHVTQRRSPIAYNRHRQTGSD